MKEQRQAGSVCNQLFTLLNRFSNLYQTNQETTCLELETGLPGETTPSPGAREELGACKQAWREGRDKEEVTPPFWRQLAI